MTIQPITGILVTLVSLETLGIMIMWQVFTRGRWHREIAGRAVMGLLGVVFLITALAATSMFAPAFPGRAWVYVALYVSLIAAVGYLGWGIQHEHFKARRRER